MAEGFGIPRPSLSRELIAMKKDGPKFSTNILATFGDRNAGSVGPR
jgi:hypothetical protein